MRTQEQGTVGLIAREGGSPIPLVGVHVHAEIVGRGARVVVRQRFRNTERRPVEAVYRSPLPHAAAVCGFRAVLADGTHVRGEVEEREKAFELYDDALAAGDGAYLLDQERPNILTLSVGNLDPGHEVSLEVEYTELLETERGLTRFSLPTSISPRYLPPDHPDGTDGIPEADTLGGPFALDVPYGLGLDLTVAGAEALEYAESPSHAIRQGRTGDTLRIGLAAEETKLDRDFVLNLKYRETFPSRAYAVTEERGTFLQVDLTLPESEAPAPEGQELVFLLDCSGSMTGSSIGEARRALDIALRALEPGTTFNVYRFGSTYEHLFPASVPYSAENLARALAWLRGIGADLGGTEIMAPLREILQGAAGAAPTRSIFLLTDGQVGNEAEILDLVAAAGGDTRLFPLGIGYGPNEYVLRELANASGGACALVAPGERLEPKTLALFGKTRTLGVRRLRIDWGEQATRTPVDLVVFPGETTSLFVTDEGGGPPEHVVVTGRTTDGDRRWELPVTVVEAAGSPIPVLWARGAIGDLEEGRSHRGGRGSRQDRGRQDRAAGEVVRLAKAFGVLSAFTSFVAVHVRVDEEKTEETAVLRTVPLMLTHDWHGTRSFAAADMAASTMALFRTAPGPSRGLGRWAAMQAASFDALAVHPATMDMDLAIDDVGEEDSVLDAILRLLSLQRAEGGFDFSEPMAGELGIKPKRVEEQAAKLTAASDDVALRLVWTAVVLGLLENRYAGEASVWRKAVLKSRRWLDQEALGKTGPEGVELTEWLTSVAARLTPGETRRSQ